MALATFGRVAAAQWRPLVLRAALPGNAYCVCTPSLRWCRTRYAVAAVRSPRLPGMARVPMLCCMFVVTEAEAAAIRAAFDQGGEFAAAVELRRHFPGIADNAHARECARIIADWKPLTLPPRPAARPRKLSHR